MIRKVSLFLLFVLLGCTENPFLKNDVTEGSNNKIYGRVILEDVSDFSGIYVWIQELNAYTWTDADGNFSFSLPSSTQSQPGGGVTGYLTIYYYMANYKLQSSSIFVFDGTFKYDQADLDENGHIKSTIALEKSVDIMTLVEPDTISLSNNSGIKISTFLIGKSSPVVVATMFDRLLGWTGFLINPLDEQIQSPYKISAGTLQEFIIIPDTTTWTTILPTSLFKLPTGSYSVVPYVRFVTYLPDGLLSPINKYINFGDNYLNFPIRFKPDTLIVVP